MRTKTNFDIGLFTINNNLNIDKFIKDTENLIFKLRNKNLAIIYDLQLEFNFLKASYLLRKSSDLGIKLIKNVILESKLNSKENLELLSNLELSLHLLKENDTELLESLLEKSKNLSRKLDSYENIGYLKLLLSISKFRNGKLDEALDLAFECNNMYKSYLELDKKNLIYYIHTLILLGEINLAKNKLLESREYFSQAINNLEKVVRCETDNLFIFKIYTQFNLSRTFLLEVKFHKSEDILDKILLNFENVKSAKIPCEIIYLLSIINSIEENHKKAYEYFSLAKKDIFFKQNDIADGFYFLSKLKLYQEKLIEKALNDQEGENYLKKSALSKLNEFANKPELKII